MISILMPIYNGVEYLRESLSSVVGQTFDQWEVLVGINGYPEGSEVWQKVSKYDSKKIRVFDLHGCHSKPQALNALVELAAHRLLCLLDVDDLWSATKLEKQLEYTDHYQVVGTHARYIGDRVDGPSIPLMEIGKDVFRLINPVVNSSAMFLKEDAHWEEIKGVEDYDLWCRLAAKGRKFFNVPEVLVSHRVHKDSAFNNRTYDESIADIRRRHGFA
jgi:teichuronic acid biosynthesis glycosyltransferase TuaG